MAHKDTSMFGDEAKKYGLDGKDGVGASSKAHTTATGPAQRQTVQQTVQRQTSAPMGTHAPARPYTPVPPPSGAGRAAVRQAQSQLAGGYRQAGTGYSPQIPPSTANGTYPTAYEVPTGGKPKATGLRAGLSTLSLILTIWGMVSLFSFAAIGLSLLLILAGFFTSIISLVLLRGFAGKARAVVALLVSGLFFAGLVYAAAMAGSGAVYFL